MDMIRAFYDQHALRPPLNIKMMMYGKKKRTRFKRDEDGNKIPIGPNTKGDMQYEKETYWVTLSKENGDDGIYPSVNAIYQRGKGGRPEYRSIAISKFEEWQVDTHLWMADQDWETVDEKIYLDFFFHMPNDNRARDTHNVFKMCLDAMNKLIYEDDHKCLPRVMDYQKVEEGEEPYIEIFIHTQAEMNDIYAKKLSPC